jgi:hypothetical protein
VTPSGASNDHEIAEERALIDGAITALSCNRYKEANSLLVEHRTRFPTGRLTAERNAARRALRARMAASTTPPLLPCPAQMARSRTAEDAKRLEP